MADQQTKQDGAPDRPGSGSSQAPQGASAAGGPAEGQPSLDQIIEQQKAQADQRLAQQQAPGGPPVAADNQAQPSLQQVLAQQRARAQQRLRQSQAQAEASAPQGPPSIVPSPSPAQTAPSDPQAFTEGDMKELEAMNPQEARIIREMLQKQEGSPSGQAGAAGMVPDSVAAVLGISPLEETSGPKRSRKVRLVCLAIGVNVLVAAGVVLVVFRMVPSVPRQAGGAQQPPKVFQAPTQPAVAQAHSRPAATPADKPVDELESLLAASHDPTRPLSRRQAEQAFLAGQYEQALAGYKDLLAAAKARPADRTVADLFQLRMALCLRQLGKAQVARALLKGPATSDSPVVRAAALYQLAEADGIDGQHLQARMKAYQAIAALAALDNRLALETDCDFLIARCLTQEVLSLHGLKASIPWGRLRYTDPFGGLEESALMSLLAEGVAEGDQGVLGPRIERVSREGSGPGMNVVAIRSPLEELLNRFSVVAGMDVEWVSVSPGARQRVVSLTGREVSQQRLSEIACGAVGLVARFTGEKVLVQDAQFSESSAQRRALWAEEAMSVWRRFFLRRPEDGRVPVGYFALACLHECSGQPDQAMQQHAVVANTYARSPVASSALLRSAKLRIQMRDYEGACKDLRDLLDRHPDCQEADEVYLSLGQTAMQTGQFEQAVLEFRKLYYLNLSPASQAQACRGIGQCLMRMGNQAEACTWLMRYVGLAKDPPAAELAEALDLLGQGQNALGQPLLAAQSFRQAIAAGPAQARRVEILLELAAIQTAAGQYADALGTLAKLDSEELAAAQRQQVLIMTARLYRTMGLTDKAVSFLRAQLPTVMDPSMKASLAVELARCQLDNAEAAAARTVLLDALGKLPVEEAKEASCLLAEALLQCGQSDQAIALAAELLQAACPDGLRRRARQVLGQAYVAKQDYEQAAIVFAEQAQVGGATP